MLAWFDPSSGQLGQPPTVPVITLRRGHHYSARWTAPVNCALVQPPLVLAALQTLGTQAGLQNPWDRVSFSTAPSALGCNVETDATWNARDTVIDPEIARLPGVAALPVEQIRDTDTGEIIYDRARIEQPQTPPPGPPPAPPPSGNRPPTSPGQPPPRPPPAPSRRRGGIGTALAVLSVIGAGVFYFARRGR